MKHFCLTLSLLILVALTPALVWAGRTELPVQGYILDTNTGDPINASLPMTFKVYENCEDDTVLWSVRKVIDFDFGLYSTTIEPDEDVILDNPDLCLGITIGSDNEMNPRLAYHAVPYAIQASKTDYAEIAGVALDIDENNLPGMVGAGLSVTNHEINLDTTYSQTWTGVQTYNSQVIVSKNPSTTSSGDAALKINPTTAVAGAKAFVIQDNGSDTFTVNKEGDVVIGGNLTVTGQLNLSSVGDITSVNAGNGLSGGALFGDASLAVDQSYGFSWTGAHDFLGGVGMNVTGTNQLFLEADGNITHADGLMEMYVNVDTNVAVDAIHMDLTAGSGIAAGTDITGMEIDMSAADNDADVFGISLLATNGNAIADSYEAALKIDNADTTSGSMKDGIIITASGGDTVVTDGLDVSDANIVNAINIGNNNILTGSATISATELNALDGFNGATIGDITSVTAGAGLTGTASAGDVTLDIGTGSGITVAADAISLGPLTGDWNQTGAFDLVLNNASSELKILESTGATFYGILDAGDLSADRTYTLPDVSGIVVTTGDTGSVSSAMIANGTISTADIAGSAVTTAEIAADTIAAADIATDAVDSAEIKADAVGAAEIVADSVGDSELDTSIAPTWTGLHTFNAATTTTKTFSANGGLGQYVSNITLTTPADSSGVNIHEGLNIGTSIGNATAGTNTAIMLNIGGSGGPGITGDADVTLQAISIGDLTATAASETAIKIGTGWDTAIDAGGTLISLTELAALDNFSGSTIGDVTAVGSMTSGVAFGDSTADDAWLGLGSAAGKIEFDDQATDEVNIINARVGIGTSTPQTALDIGSGFLSGGTYSSEARNTLNLSSTPAASSQYSADLNFVSGGVFRMAEASVLGTNDIFFQLWPATTSGYGYLEAWASAGMVMGTGNATPIIFRPNRSEAMRILSSGKVGIGDTTADQLLEVMSSGAAATQITVSNTNAGDYDPQIGFELADGTNTYTMGVDDSDSDKFKISTTALGTSDLFTLDSSGNAVFTGTVTFSGATTAGDITSVGSMTSGVAFGDSTADDDWLGLGSGAGRIEFDDQATDEVNILSSNVGIGTSSPNKAFDVRGDSVFYSSSGSYSEGINVFRVGSGVNGEGLNFHEGSAGTATGASTLSGYIRIIPTTGHDSLMLGVFDGTTDRNALFIQNSDAFVGIGDSTPDYFLELYDPTNTPAFALSDDDVAHGLTGLAQTDVFSHLTSLSTTAGGAEWTAISDTNAQAMSLRGVIGSTDPTDATPAVRIIGAKSDGATGKADLAAAETVFAVANNDDADALTVLGNGNVAISGALTVGGSSITGDITAVGSMTSGVAFGDSTADDDWLGLGSGAGRIEFDDQATDEVNILTANVGIGTSTPGTKLDIDAGGTTHIMLGQNAAAPTYNGVYLNGTMNDSTHLGISGGGGSDNNLYVDSGSSGQIVFRTGGSTEKMRMDSSGDIIITDDDAWVGASSGNNIFWNDTTGSGALNYKGSFTINIDSNNNDADTEALYIAKNKSTLGSSGALATFLESGNVGIGDTTPASMLTVGNGDLFQVDSSGNIVKLNNITYSWPSSQAAGSGYTLSNNGSGTLTWVDPAATGDITGVTASTGLSGGGTSGTVSLSVDQAFTPTWTGAHTLTKTNAAGGSATPLTISSTLAAMNGTDTYNGLSITPTNANHTGVSNYVVGLNIGGITADADADESAIVVGAGWDSAISFFENDGGGQAASIVAPTTLAGFTQLTLPTVSGTFITTGDTGTVNATIIATDAVDAAEIKADAVGTSEIATDGVGAAEIVADAVGDSELDTSIAPTWTGLHTFNAATTTTKTFSANGGVGQYVDNVTFTTPVDTSGVNIHEGVNIATSIGNATAGTNTAIMLNLGGSAGPGITGDAEVTLQAINIGDLTATAASETAIKIGTGWDTAIDDGGILISPTELALLDGQTTFGDITGVTAGNGLTGTASSGAVSLDVGAGTGITAAADSISVDQSFTPTWTGAHTFTNSATTTDGITITGAALTTGSNIVATGTTGGTAGITDSNLKTTTNVGNAGSNILSTATFNSATGGSSYNGNFQTTNNPTSSANTGYGLYSYIYDSSSLANSDVAVYGRADNEIAISSGTKSAYGGMFAGKVTLATGGTSNVYGVSTDTGYASVADAAATVNQYGLYVANGFSDTLGTSTEYGIYVEAMSGADNNYAAVFAGGNVGIGDTTPAALLTVGSGDKFQVATSGNVTLADGVLMDLSSINASSTTEGLKLPQATDTSSATAEGQISWDSDNDTLYIGTGAGRVAMAASSLPSTGKFTDSTSDTLNDSAQVLWDGTQPNITPSSSSNTILVSIYIKVDATGTDNEINNFKIFRSTDGANADCNDVAVGDEMSNSMTTISASDVTSATGTFIDEPATTNQLRYTVCETTNSAASTTLDNTTPYIEISLVELGADLAENYYTTDATIEAGHVVAIDGSLPAGVKKSQKPYDGSLLGIVSTAPGHVLDDAIGKDRGRAVPVALSGRVPVKVTTHAGKDPIKIGDYLTASEIPGIAMKATRAGQVIAKALTEISQGEGAVLAFVESGWQGVADEPEADTENDTDLMEDLESAEKAIPESMILRSPGGKCFKVQVSDEGQLTSTPAECE